VIAASDVAALMPLSFGQAVVGAMIDGDDTRSGVVIEEGVPAKALSAKHRVPFRNLEKRPRSVAANAAARRFAAPRFDGQAAASRPHRL